MPRTVLIVDDERDTNDILARMVQARGFEPIQLFEGVHVLAAVRKQAPDLVLLDLMMPDLDGFAVCEQMKRNRETNLIPIVLDAARAGSEVPVFGSDWQTVDGTCVRDYIDVRDLAAAHVDALEHVAREVGGPTEFNIGTAVGAALVSRWWIGLVVGVAALVSSRVAGGRVLLTAGAPLALALGKLFDTPKLGWLAVGLLGADVVAAWLRARTAPHSVVAGELLDDRVGEGNDLAEQ